MSNSLARYVWILVAFTIMVFPQKGVAARTELKMLSLLSSGASSGIEEAVKRKYPSIALEVTRPIRYNPAEIPTMISSGEYDLLAVPDMTQWIVQGLLAPLDAYVRGSDATLIKRTEVYRVSGHLYDLPITMNPYVIAYNTAFMDDLGIVFPKSRWKLSDFMQMLQRANSVVWGSDRILATCESQPTLWTLLLQQNGTSLLDLGDDNFQRTLEAVTDGYPEKPLFACSDRGLERLGNGFACLYVGLPTDGLLAKSLRTAEVSYGIAPMPSLGIGSDGGFTAGYVRTVGISAKSKHQREAWSVVSLLSGTEGAELMASAAQLPPYPTSRHIQAWLSTMGTKPPKGIELLQSYLALPANRKYGDADRLFTADLASRFSSDSLSRMPKDRAMSIVQDLVQNYRNRYSDNR